VTAIGLQWALICEPFFEMWHNNKWHDLPLDMYTVYITTTIVAVPLISLGGIIGKITPLQLIIMVIVEIVIHAILAVLLYGYLEVTDIGATYGIHMFGCYFGLAVSYMIGAPPAEPDVTPVSDLFSLVGTAFLWVYWPSFVGGFLEVDSEGQQYALRNTILALLGSTVMSYAYSAYYNFDGGRRFRPVDIQNATLAGGVAIGCLADLHINPGCALLVGAFCGFLSTWGYNFLQPYLCESHGLHDTCGINNLHGMPSIAGALISVFVAGIASDHAQESSYHYKQGRQAVAQFAGLLLTLVYAIVTGLATGALMKTVGPPEGVDIKKFQDACWWEISAEEEPASDKKD
jgi:ammonium transporter Rh